MLAGTVITQNSEEGGDAEDAQTVHLVFAAQRRERQWVAIVIHHDAQLFLAGFHLTRAVELAVRDAQVVWTARRRHRDRLHWRSIVEEHLYGSALVRPPVRANEEEVVLCRDHVCVLRSTEGAH